jgi:hypothetical protein
MATPREKATAFILKYIEKLLPGSPNSAYYKTMLGDMSEGAFKEFMQRLRDGEETLFLTAPNLMDQKLTVRNNLAIAEELGYSFYERCWITDPKSGKRYRTPHRYMTLKLPIRRQVQLLQKKISIPEDNHTIDELSGQPTGPSKGSKISFPQLQVMAAQDINRALEELTKFRGGDIEAGQALDRSIVQTGSANLDTLVTKPTLVRSVETLSTLLKGAHLDNNLAD